ncbi:D-alanyl-D-alanine carboxypeptidase [Clostridium thermosuccinogenes]|uniref:serine-type D-Ala-D-Ala carboxypeptidase n=1 Tax=Clostridium thermosuccinogenes TaxID=84032 RepID=A0A2K2FGY2_9CLOT|nr:D-alanyl-D-alanine carboxypeptidase [Pseudoclostridium thermosuccinogenes]PNT96394.1 D-alanyl-D-alanine carboxypeptidase [Pseudoclostridium thermosuccinogenes]PNT98047.1 D-alanyl-D-alanine carboxypeptidase [Pseudoclostridium thermosuccinogenes]
MTGGYLVLKKIIIYSLLFAIIFTMPIASTVLAGADSDVEVFTQTSGSGNALNLKAKGAILIDGTTGTVLFEHNSRERLPMASVTKIMTMLLTMEAIDTGRISYDDMIPASPHAISIGTTQLWLKEGEEFSVRDMLKAVTIRSANDAAIMLAEKIAGSEEAFVAKMNEKAAELGMKDTKFMDCSGLTDEGQYSTAYDIAIMSRELLTKYPEIIEYTTKWHDTIRDGKTSLDNTNKLIRSYDGIIGLKTGYTEAAGYNLSAAAKRNNLMLISVVLGEPDSNTRFRESAKLLDYGFANYELADVNKKGEELLTIEVKKGLSKNVVGVLKSDVQLLLPKGYKGKIERKVRAVEELVAPVAEGQKIGEAVYLMDGKEINKADIVAQYGVEKTTFTRLLIKMLSMWFCIGRR